MKGIILAGGTGSRLFPITQGVSKQLVPVYDKPMVYYPLSVLMLAGIREVLVITTPEDNASFRALLGDGDRWGMDIQYAVQHQPNGLAEAFIIGREFVGDDDVSLILGDNIFYGNELQSLVQNAAGLDGGARVFGYWVSNPERYGVVDFDDDGVAVSLEEKPDQPRSHWAVTGLYFYDNQVLDFARDLEPSDRGELEITDLNRLYLEQGELEVELLGRGMAWLDTGTHDSLLEASNFIGTIQRRQGLLIGSPEEIAWRAGWIDDEKLAECAEKLGASTYGQRLKDLLAR
jgi:glucose-1-phosphate thymidylyltransferase